jgi:hypothetical protein
MKEIKIKRRWLSISAILFVILSLLFAFGWINSEVSYKYEVQDTVYSGKPLDEHQKDILYYIASSKVEFTCCVVLLVLTLYVNGAEPTFKGRVYYTDKK